MEVLIVSCSLRQQSKSRILAMEVKKRLEGVSRQADWIDLKETPLPFCDGSDGSAYPLVETLKQKVRLVSTVVLAVPVYNYDVNAVCKNFIEWMSDDLKGKKIALVASAGGYLSYMSLANIANDLMFNFLCSIIPEFVYAVEKQDFENERVVSADIHQRLNSLVEKL
jgi:NAD(P)H-dependent FMN reductase